MRALLFGLCLALLGPLAQAQIDLPEKPVSKGSNSPPVDLPAPQRGDLAKKVLGRADGAPADPPPLDLPATASTRPAPLGAAAHAPNAVTPVSATTALDSAARFIFDEVAKARSLEQPVVLQAVASLANLGESGLVAARVRLSSDHEPTLLVSARVLLTGAQPSDAEFVVQRMKGRLPGRASASLVAALVELDPVRASPALFAELLTHRQGAMRIAAQRRLALAPASELAEALPIALAARSSDARLRAVQLAATLDDPHALDLLFGQLADPTATVSRRVVDALAVREDERLEPELLRRAFEGRWILRENAYALLAIVEREDVLLRPMLSPTHADALLGGLVSTDAFVSGTCAAALAGVGFRTPLGTSPELDRWLDGDVPSKLVRTVAGADFHNDFSALLPTALRRLALIGGERLGTDGAAWVAWWTKVGPGFRALRAVLPATPEDAVRLRVAYLSSVGSPESFVLVGPSEQARAALPEVLRGGRLMHLSNTQVGELFEVLRSEDVLAAERLPGSRGSAGSGERTLEVAVGESSKTFRFRSGASEPWFERVVASARAMSERCRWQLYPEPGSEESAYDAFLAEGEWWDSQTSELERDLRLKGRILKALYARPLMERDEGLAELVALAASEGRIAGEDLTALNALLAQEHFFGPRARELTEIARAAARMADDLDAPTGAEAPDIATSGPSSAAGNLLVDTLEETFGAAAAEQIAAVLAERGRDVSRRAAGDPRPLLRAVAASLLAREPGPVDLALLGQLLRDEVQPVEVAAVLAIGDGRVNELRTEVLLRARVADDPVRAAALRAAGRLGGDHVLDVLVLGLSDRGDPSVPLAAAEGLASLADPSTASLFVSMLSRGGDDPLVEPARQGLLALGSIAWPELSRAMESPTSRARREAALILARQGVARAAPVLIGILADDAADLRVAAELAVISGADLRAEGDPATAWWSWWQDVVQADSLVWLLGALEREGVPTPESAAIAGAGSLEGAVFLASVLYDTPPHLAERGRRELGRLLGRELHPPVEAGAQREAWQNALQEEIAARYK